MIQLILHVLQLNQDNCVQVIHLEIHVYGI